MVKIKLDVDVEGIGNKGDYISVSPEMADKLVGEQKATLRQETAKDGSFV